MRDECRRLIAARGLTSDAVAHLTRDALGHIDLERLAPLKALLKRFFSDAPWTEGDQQALADVVGPGDGWWKHELDEGVGLEFGWRDGAFRIELSSWDRAGSLVAEATPNPRTMRFVTGPIHDGPSRWYESATGVDDPRVAQLFAAFEDVDNVLVGPDFVAVGLRRPDRWPALLEGVTSCIEEQFVASASTPEVTDATEPAQHGGSRAPRGRDRGIERAWKALGQLRVTDPADRDRLIAALSSSDVGERQVAARLIGDAENSIAYAAWDRLLDDSSRSVRRATVDVMVDADREAVRPLLERALLDSDAWIRWKAVVGLVALGIERSYDAVAPLAQDPDFRVRREATNVLRT